MRREALQCALLHIPKNRIETPSSVCGPEAKLPDSLSSHGSVHFPTLTLLDESKGGGSSPDPSHDLCRGAWHAPFTHSLKTVRPPKLRLWPGSKASGLPIDAKVRGFPSRKLHKMKAGARRRRAPILLNSQKDHPQNNSYRSSTPAATPAEHPYPGKEVCCTRPALH